MIEIKDLPSAALVAAGPLGAAIGALAKRGVKGRGRK